MSSDRRGSPLLSALLPALALAVAAVALSALIPPPAATPAREPAPCEPAPLELRAALGRLNGGDVALFTDGRLVLRACRPGVLRLSARGRPAAGIGAHVVVSGPSGTLFEDEVTAPRRLALDVETPGWIAIAFLNDGRVGGEDRTAWLDGVRFVPRR